MSITTGPFGLKVASFAAFLAMAITGWKLAGGSSDTSAKNQKVLSPDSGTLRPALPLRTSAIDPAAARKMDGIRNAATPADRLRAAIGLAGSLPVSEFAAWLDGGWFDMRGGPELIVFTQIVKERWKQEDLEGFARWGLKHDRWNTTSALASLAAQEPLRVLAYFIQHPDDQVELLVLAEMAGNHPALALQRLQELSEAGLAERDSYNSVIIFKNLAEKSPAAFGALLDSLDEPMRTRAEHILIGENLKNSHAGEIRKLWERSDGWAIYMSAFHQIKEKGGIFDELANLPAGWRASIASDARSFIDEANSEKWWNADLAGLGFTQLDEARIRNRALAGIAVKDPERALKLMAGIERTHPHGDDRWEIIQNALTGRLDRTDEFIALMGSEVDRALARQVVDRIAEKTAEEASRSAIENIETPDQWLEQALATDPIARYALSAHLTNWDPAKLAGLANQFHALPDDRKRQVAEQIAGSVSGSDPRPPLVGEAIRYLITTNPPATQMAVEPATSMAVTYVGHLATEDPERAGEWISTLPDGQPKLWAQVNLHSVWTHYDPLAADQWFNSLPAGVQAEVRKVSQKE